MLLIPYQVDVPMRRWPIGNFALIGAICIVSILALNDDLSENTIVSMILDGWSLTGMIGHLFLHMDYLHLFGNMVFLWVFGNAVCAKVGNLWYPLVFLGLGLAAATCHNLFDGATAIGASGAINGIVGMFLVWYPLNNVTCFYLIIIKPGRFSVSSYWMILLWLVFDVWGLAVGGDGVAYAAHLGGFVAGVALAALLERLNRVEFEHYEKTLCDCMGIARRTGEYHELGEELLPPTPSITPAVPAVPTPTIVQGRTKTKIHFACGQCGHRIAVSVDHVGKKGRCPQCSTVVVIPTRSQPVTQPR